MREKRKEKEGDEESRKEKKEGRKCMREGGKIR
jgi:hypothetical protein